ncbi:hypothetical protein P608_04965 [Comamonas thiooxydans]|uniref:Uncharacterized protein n=1 Tax=Comamonas thiooxydans TaxID=363952 RepID=A0A0E3BYY3_9BURK|nr:hypothetical protein P369_22555 [Comamonas thiooxydans]KGG94272.1 hypothetical protein P367_23095 [Comamonas thiooxydans]KGH18511.1 hypothetical protein P608_04965 [Comamonas thiooxydans]KGH19289.1 hypothetical protein P607_11305 [Comamonas thiooxydans]
MKAQTHGLPGLSACQAWPGLAASGLSPAA